MLVREGAEAEVVWCAAVWCGVVWCGCVCLCWLARDFFFNRKRDNAVDDLPITRYRISCALKVKTNQCLETV